MFLRLILIFLLIDASFLTAAAAAEDGVQTNLPAGYYVYLGDHPGQDTPRGLRIKFDGYVDWQTPPTRTTTNVTPMTATVLKREATGQQPKEKNADFNWDSYSWPVIVWKPHPVTTITDGVAVLETKFDGDLTKNFGGKAKYKLRLFKVDKTKLPYFIRVQLLDASGFKLVEFQVSRDSFHPIPGTSLLEAVDEFHCPSKEYSEARDYLVQ